MNPHATRSSQTEKKVTATLKSKPIYLISVIPTYPASEPRVKRSLKRGPVTFASSPTKRVKPPPIANTPSSPSKATAARSASKKVTTPKAAPKKDTRRDRTKTDTPKNEIVSSGTADRAFVPELPKKHAKISLTVKMDVDQPEMYYGGKLNAEEADVSKSRPNKSDREYFQAAVKAVQVPPL